ncbi:Zn-dependent hydrolase [Brevirhabdus pacifica]|uniref:Zn-dependent hydrolase n=1 Tax=Brevirhabdus pacifica TaxID=1267768 RepID=A0A1U7DM85_9RHOB|nr:Zn-dependent hydrolase [Brevirhabdus pacifica]OWU76907.1 Zn-dependent hydrolase [Loktanella sp. 22II-4b]
MHAQATGQGAAPEGNARTPRVPSHCIALAGDIPGARFAALPAGAGPRTASRRARARDPLPEEMVRLSYLAHASFLIETPGGLSAVTDYTGFIGATDFFPDVATMNRAHETHWTAMPDPRIPHVLKGWGPTAEGVEHRLDLGEMLVRNVNTDIRSAFDETVDRNGNSIFVFEVAGLCIGHLGHLHHEPDAAQYAALGRLDVVMAAVDGGTTLDLPRMMRVLRRLRSSVVLPMHWFRGGSLERFVAAASAEFDIRQEGENSVTLSLRSLPRRPTVIVLRPNYLRAPQPD